MDFMTVNNLHTRMLQRRDSLDLSKERRKTSSDIDEESSASGDVNNPGNSGISSKEIVSVEDMHPEEGATQKVYATSVSRFFNCHCKSCMHATLTMRWFPAAVVCVAIVWSYYAFVVALCLHTMHDRREKGPILILFHPLYLLMVVSYVRAMLAPVHSPSEDFYMEPDGWENIQQMDLEKEISRSLDIKTCELRYCYKCNFIKPDRCHHCSTCRSCVLKMDHHCPWVGNCVGFHNHKFFVLFLFYADIYCVVSLILSSYHLSPITGTVFSGNVALSSDLTHVALLFILSIVFGIPVNVILIFHLDVLFRNRTTLEKWRPLVFRVDMHDSSSSVFAINKTFNLGCYANFVQVFGVQKLLWPLPVFTSEGDGASFPLKCDFKTIPSFSEKDSTRV